MNREEFINKVISKIQNTANSNEVLKPIVKDFNPFFEADYNKRIILISTFLAPFKFSLDDLLQNMAKKYQINPENAKNDYNTILKCMEALITVVE